MLALVLALASLAAGRPKFAAPTPVSAPLDAARCTFRGAAFAYEDVSVFDLEPGKRDMLQTRYMFGTNGAATYVDIPKCASTSIWASLKIGSRHPANGPRWINRIGVEKYAKSYEDLMEQVANSTKTFSFTFVRHPADRLDSGLAEVFMRTRGSPFWNGQVPTTTADYIRFLEDVFLNSSALEARQGTYYRHRMIHESHHILPQLFFMTHVDGSPRKLDFVGHLETLESDWADMGAAMQPLYQLPPLIKTRSNQKIGKNGRHLAGDNFAFVFYHHFPEIFEREYRGDFECLGYDWNEFTKHARNHRFDLERDPKRRG